MNDTQPKGIQLLPDADDIHLPHDVLERIVKSIVDSVPTAAIYIFGSYARGEEHKDSDIDIYIVTADEKKHRYDYAGDALESLDWLDMAMDVLTKPLWRFNHDRQFLYNIEAAVDDEGKLIYGSPALPDDMQDMHEQEDEATEADGVPKGCLSAAAKNIDFVESVSNKIDEFSAIHCAYRTQLVLEKEIKNVFVVNNVLPPHIHNIAGLLSVAQENGWLEITDEHLRLALTFDGMDYRPMDDSYFTVTAKEAYDLIHNANLLIKMLEEQGYGALYIDETNAKAALERCGQQD
ncbi:MAG: nucleotidyltransferase domain-containing protein [Eggerthellaceae bacterium]|nr:nucleotidyltransferase domain-containing protein [Eggerthellaceae bacterium]